jgi:hypothetical protein
MDELEPVVMRDPATWLPVAAKLLPAAKTRLPAANRLRAVAANFLAWDTALGGGRTTEW